MRLLIFVFAIACVSGSVGQFTKWLRNTDLNNPYNWDRGNLPCGNDRMILPDDGPVVFMQLNTTIQELVLPRDGELVFGSYATLAFTNNPDHSAACLDSGTDITFNASHPANWLDPDNWCPTDSEQGSCQPMALLDSERIPCQTDHVIFPTGSSYYVNLGTNLNIKVNTLKVSGKAYSTTSFRDFLATENGRNIFPAPQPGPRSTVNIMRRACKDDTGCGCGNDQGQILSQVCQIQRSRCRRTRCTRTIKPVGHCCDICGGMLNISYGVGFNLNTLKNGIQRNFLDGKDAYKNVKYIVSKRTDGKIQMVLLDDDGVQSSKVTAEIMADLNSDINSGGLRYGVTQVSLASSATGGPSTGSGGGSASAHTGTGSKKGSMSKGSVAGITIGVIIAIIIGLAVGYFVYQNKNRQPDESAGFSVSVFSKFNRFNASQKRKPQVSVPPSVGFSWGSRDSGLSSISGATSQGFDNPIYGSVPMENMKQMDLEMTPGDFSTMSDTQPDKGFDNPLYDTVHQVKIQIMFYHIK
ncbi:protein amnionless-like [Ruditapes philippinarum]|uniref:protein amnionless-like n=1 Tax=Ruditapes philippinarum TaxID=129788 RepID=UPI00295AB091|nr:protein amnionless-like [Ruditapes philippinarum]